MKKFIIKLIALTLTLTSALSFTSCKESKDEDTSFEVGIIQYMSHPSLDNCYNGVVEALNASEFADSIVIDRQIGSASSADSDCSNFAKTMAAKDYDMIIAIATPAAISAYAATEGSDIPVVFCAVSDPVAAELVESLDKPGDICTGTSDVLDLDAQLNLIKTLQPDLKTVGILYTTSEVNSITNLENFKAIAAKSSIEVDAIGIQNGSEVPAAAATLAARVDCINNFTDNNVVNNLAVVLDASNNAGIPVYGSEVEQVNNGCLASVSIDYVALGKVTGEMAVEILGGADASTMAVKTISDATPVINESVAQALGISYDGIENIEIVK